MGSRGERQAQAAGGRSRGAASVPESEPTAPKRRLAKERRSPSAMERAKKAGGGGSGAIHRVLGDWVDTCRNEYEVQLDKGGTSCTVKTTRPTGIVIKTRALIRLAGKSIIWGESYVLDNGRPWKSQLRWLRLGDVRGDFVWKRL